MNVSVKIGRDSDGTIRVRFDGTFKSLVTPIAESEAARFVDFFRNGRHGQSCIIRAGRTVFDHTYFFEKRGARILLSVWISSFESCGRFRVNRVNEMEFRNGGWVDTFRESARKVLKAHKDTFQRLSNDD